MSRRRASLTAALLALPLLAAGLAGGVDPALAVTGSPPVTAPDNAGSTYPGNVLFANPLGNDTDPDKDELALCRFGPEDYKGVHASYDGFDYAVYTGQKAKPGTYTFTYYACDFSYLTAGTVTVTIEEPPAVDLKAITSRPGYVRVVNPADFAVRVLYGSFREEGPDGNVLVRAGKSKVIKVARDKIDWIAYNRNGDLYLKTGHLRNIPLRRGEAVARPGEALRGFAWGPTR